MKSGKWFLLSIFLLSSMMAFPVCAGETYVKSPDKNLAVKVYAGDDGHLMMEVSRKGETILKPSHAGIIVNKTDMGEKAVIGKSKRYSVDEKYPWRGNH